MMRDDKIVHRVKVVQQTVFRQAELPLKAISYDSDIGYPSLQKYASGDTGMSLVAFHKLVGVLPNELLSLLLPDGFQIVEAPEGIDHDRLAEHLHEYLALKTAAHCPASPAGREISDCERQKLDEKVVQIPIEGRAA